MNGVEVIKQMEPQKTKGTTVLNNNRYLVVKSVDPQVKKLDVSTSLTIMGNHTLDEGRAGHSFTE